MFMRAAKTVRFTALLALAALAAFASSALAQVGPSCTITGPESSCGPAELCGPEGNYSYYWARPFGGIESTRCIQAYESGGYILWLTDLSTGIQGEPCFHKVDIGTPVTCDITGPDEFCLGSKVDLCGPDGDFLYSWTGPGGFTAATRCITVITAGDYTLTVSNPDGSCASTCKHSLSGKTCIINCPRTVGFWGAQCAQKNNGSTKFTKLQVASIASCVDGRSSFFSWGANPFNGFCAVISNTDMSQRVQAKRQYAGVLANICTGGLGLVANNGDHIQLSAETIVSCGGSLETIGDLIASVDAQLASLESKSLADASVKAAYDQIIQCMDDINNGRGIGAVCPELLTLSLSTAELQAADGRDPVGVAPATLFRAYPNPFANTTRLAYAVAAQGEQVSLGVYDLSGRVVKHLFDGFQTGGEHQAAWDATDMIGARVRTGMYFIRGRVGDRAVASQVMFIR
jgi:hypothetical protein